MIELANTDDDEESTNQPFVRNVSGYKRGIFIEERCNDLDEAEYPRNGYDPGLVIIFNYETFATDFSTRTGTRKDVQELIDTLGRLKFNIDEKFIFNDFAKHEIEAEIKKISAMDLSRHNCLICVFLSHGAADNKLVVYDDVIEAENVYGPFAKCATLRGKPKMFIFQACKKGQKAKNNKIAKTAELVCERTLQLDIPKDCLLVYSTLEGEVSFRNSQSGTWFIQELCKIFTAYGRRDDAVSLITRTAKCVAYNYHVGTEEKWSKQMPIYVSTLSKKFFLTQSFDRILLNRILKENQHLRERIEELNRRVDDICQLRNN